MVCKRVRKDCLATLDYQDYLDHQVLLALLDHLDLLEDKVFLGHLDLQVRRVIWA